MPRKRNVSFTSGAIREGRTKQPTPIRLAESLRRDGFHPHKIPLMVEETMKEIAEQDARTREMKRKEANAICIIKKPKERTNEEIKSAISTITEISGYDAMRRILGIVVSKKFDIEIRKHALRSAAKLAAEARKSRMGDADRELNRFCRTANHIISNGFPQELKDALIEAVTEYLPDKIAKAS